MQKKEDIKNLTRSHLAGWLEMHGIKPYRAAQIEKWIYLHQADTFEEMSDIGKETRQILDRNFYIGRFVKSRVEKSKDGSMKYLFRLSDSNFVESVLIPEKNHYTLCISTQVGCAQGCKFCLTAKGGFVRNLSKGEIIAQVRDIKHDIEENKNLSNIVLMGMGEPLANYNNVVNAVKTILDSNFGLKFSRRRVTISTSGIVSKFKNLAKDINVKLAVSLNATENRTRSMLMPVNKKYSIEALLYACKNYPLKSGERITFEYVLLKGINDSISNAKRLVRLLESIKVKINLIPFNEHPTIEFKRPTESVIAKFQKILHKNNFTAIIRQSKGEDISAACGQLAGKMISTNF